MILTPKRYFVEAIFHCKVGPIKKMAWHYTDSSKDIVGLFRVINEQVIRDDTLLDATLASVLISKALEEMDVSSNRAKHLWNVYMESRDQ